MPGFVHIYCGDGKGKTTAAFGLSIRAAGHGMKVLIVQFLKSSPTGELESIRLIPNITVLRSDKPMGFTFQMNEQEKADAKKIQQGLLEQAKKAVSKGCNLLVLDEIMAACSAGMISEEQVLDFIRTKPEPLELVLTGRNPPKSFLDMADYVSEIKKVKHPVDKGIGARDGIEQ